MVPPSGIINYHIHANFRKKFFTDFSSGKKENGACLIIMHRVKHIG